MPDKLTDSEIIKALECKIKFKCNECPYFHSFPCDKCHTMLKDVLDLINRQKAENERANKEIDRLSQVVLYNDGVTEMKVEEAKAEAYKEFAERLEKEFSIIKTMLPDESEYLLVAKMFESALISVKNEMVVDDKAYLT